MGKKSILTKKEREEIIKGMRDATMDKLDEMKIPEVSQEACDHMAKQLHALYSAFVGAGFTKAQAMELLKFSMSMGAGIIK